MTEDTRPPAVEPSEVGRPIGRAGAWPSSPDPAGLVSPDPTAPASPEPNGMISPDPTGLEAWIRQVLGLAGARASAFTLPLPRPTAPADAAPAEGAQPGTAPADTAHADTARAGNPAAGPDADGTGGA
ncbi:hypothetical protein [Microbispora sp. H10885]|uniref:hypothetical protein n=1 Tax=Microbispora sp. H10885 TaxID=2729110 RepID=UPI0016027282|nr:hypothetical protein [Microbispora sp. H10885]